MNTTIGFPKQQLPLNRKNKQWRKSHLDWADNNDRYNSGKIRKSYSNKKINYDLVNGILNMEDLALVLNPSSVEASFVPEKIQHYPIINSKLNILRGEEVNRRFSFRVVCTNPSAISEIEKEKQQLFFQDFQKTIESNAVSEEDLNAKMEELYTYYNYTWQDLREIRANALLNHYYKELALESVFSNGFMDGMAVGEEIYMCDIISGEPTMEKLDPMRVRCYGSGFSNKIEDSDIVVIEDFWSRGRVIDSFYDKLNSKDVEYLENITVSTEYDEMDHIDDRKGFIHAEDITIGDVVDTNILFAGGNPAGLYYDQEGNVRVLRVFWKSRRAIKKVKSYDPDSGEEFYEFYPESYVIDESLGEEEEILWVDEAWGATKIGEKIFVDMGPRLIQYQRLSNPSKCHFGIVGRIYNLNNNRVFSLVDMMKPFSYLYDVVHDRLNVAIAANWGEIMELDLASVPKGWDVEKWMYYAKINHLAVKDSFNEGNYGTATGKLAGGFANNSRGLMSTNTGNYIQQHIQLLEFIKMEMSECIGITKQREGQISSRETFGGIERSTLQSSHTTEWLMLKHNEAKIAALECLLETAKIALKGKSKKFQYILSDHSLGIASIDGDEFSENDYGLIVDSSPRTMELEQKLDSLAQAALQNQLVDFSTIMKIYTNTSIAETQRLIESKEIERKKAAQQEAQRATQIQEAQIQRRAELEERKLALESEMNERNNQTKLEIAYLNSSLKSEALDKDGEDKSFTEAEKEKLLEKMRALDQKMAIEKERLKQGEQKLKLDEEKLKQSKNNKK